jgi:hypothetical protein
LLVEIAAQGDTALLAQGRAETLAFSANICIQTHRAGSAAGLTRSDLGGSASQEKITNWLTAASAPDPNTSGPGDDPRRPLWTAKKYLKVEIWITKIVTTASS